MKKLFTLLLAVVCAVGVFAHDFSQKYNGKTIYYKITSSTAPYTVGVTYGGTSLSSAMYSGNITIPASVTYNGNTYSVTTIGSFAFRDCSGLTSVTIPNSVMSIEWTAFYNCSSLTNINVNAENSDFCSVDGILFNKDRTTILCFPAGRTETSYTIPTSVTSIGGDAFYGCSGLTSIEIPNSVTSIEGSAFGYCSGLTSVTIPNSVMSIGNYAFRDCSTLTSVTIGNSVTSIGKSAFFNCSGLTSVTIPESVTSIGSAAFGSCSGLTSVTIPESVTSIANSAFRDCSSLTSINVNATNPYYCSVDGILFNKAQTIIHCFPAGKTETSYTIPNSVTSIGSFAFCGCSGLTSVTIPESVTSIESYAFHYCSGLTRIAIPNSVTSIGHYAFYKCSSLSVLAIHGSVTSIGDRAFYNCSNLKKVYNCSALNIVKGSTDNGYVAYYADKVVNGCPDYVEDYMFMNGQLIDYLGTDNAVITLPNDYNGNTYSIAAEAFKGHTELTSVTIPNSVVGIGENAFSGCYNLKKVYNCSGLYIVKGSTEFGYVTYYAEKVVNGCPDAYVGNFVFGDAQLIDYLGTEDSVIVLPNDYNGNSYSIATSAFIEHTELTSVTIPESVTSIENNAFNGCSGLTSIEIPNSVTSIGWSAFSGCSSLTSITIPNSVTSIGGSAFNGCSSLTSIVWNAQNCNSPSWHGSAPFYGIRSQITNFVIGDSVQTIPAYLCYGMSNLQSVTIPKTVSVIGEGAFYGCSGLTRVDITDLAVWCGITFGDATANPLYYAHHLYPNCTEVTDLVIPDGVTEIRNYAFCGCSGLTSIEIPESVTSIGNYAFSGCSGLTSIEIPESVSVIGNYTFQYCSGLTSILIPESVTSIGNYAFQYCSNLKKVYNCSALNIVKGSTGNGYVAYYADKVLECPDDYVGDYVFSNGQLIDYLGTDSAAITLPNDYNGNSYTITAEVFKGHTELTSVIIPESVTSIGENAFYNCSGLTSVVWNARNCSNPSSEVAAPFYDIRTQITNFVIGDSVQSIPAYLCYEMSNLQSVTIPESVTSIGNNTFSGCSSLTSVTIPNSVSVIGDDAFSGCTAINTVHWNAKNCPKYDFPVPAEQITMFTIGSDVEVIPAGLCKDMINNAATEMILPKVKTIGTDAFNNGARRLAKLELGVNTDEIGENAFANCTRLTNITCYATTPPLVETNSFTNYNGYLYIPCEVLEDYEMDLTWGQFQKKQCVESETTTAAGDSITVNPSENDAEFTWPTTDGAETYTLEITKDGVVFCTLRFNANGQLVGIAFAPARDGEHARRAAAATGSGWTFTVTGLDAASLYSYSMTAKDAAQQTIVSYTGYFATTGFAGEIPTMEYTITPLASEGGVVTGGGTFESGNTCILTATPATGYEFAGWSDGNTDNPRTITVTHDATYTAIFAEIPNGIEDILEPAKVLHIYTITGQEVTAQRDNLPAGMYVFVTDKGTEKVIIK